MDIAFWPRCTTITKGRKWQLFRAALPFEASQELLPEKMKSPAAFHRFLDHSEFEHAIPDDGASAVLAAALVS